MNGYQHVDRVAVYAHAIGTYMKLFVSPDADGTSLQIAIKAQTQRDGNKINTDVH